MLKGKSGAGGRGWAGRSRREGRGERKVVCWTEQKRKRLEPPERSYLSTYHLVVIVCPRSIIVTILSSLCDLFERTRVRSFYFSSSVAKVNSVAFPERERVREGPNLHDHPCHEINNLLLAVPFDDERRPRGNEDSELMMRRGLGEGKSLRGGAADRRQSKWRSGSTASGLDASFELKEKRTHV